MVLEPEDILRLEVSMPTVLVVVVLPLHHHPRDLLPNFAFNPLVGAFHAES